MKPYAITGLGPVSPIGVGRAAFHASLAAPPDSGAVFRTELSTLSPEKLPGAVAAEVWDFDAAEYLGNKGLRNFDRLTKFMIVAAKLALEDSGLKADGEHLVHSAQRVGICSATAYGSLDAITELVQVAELEDPRFLNPSRFPNTVINSAAGYVSIWEDLQAPNVTVVDGNCGALDAILTSTTHMSNDRADAFVVGGGEVLSEPLYLAFRKLELLAEQDAVFRPGHADSAGLRLGEGAASMCIEPRAAAEARGATIHGCVVGYGTAFEPPESEAIIVHASATAVERALRMALDDAGVAASDIQLVCASASGLAPFDAAEIEGIDRVLGPAVAVIAPKARYGETFGAGGALAVTATLGWMNGVPPAPLVRGETPPQIEHAVVLAVGFYGNVSAVVIQK